MTRLKQQLSKLQEIHKQHKLNKPKLINPVPNPRFDEVYYRGVAWLDEG